MVRAVPATWRLNGPEFAQAVLDLGGGGVRSQWTQ